MADPAYGTAHQKRRIAWAAEIKRIGEIQCDCRGTCRRHEGQCPTLIRHGDKWHLGHGVADKYGGDGTDSTPWCPGCNQAEGGRIGTKHRKARRASRAWGRPVESLTP